MENKYTTEEIEIIKQYYPISTKEKMLELLPNHSYRSIAIIAGNMGRKKTRLPWTEKDIYNLSKLAEEQATIKEMVVFFNGFRDEYDIRKQLRKLGCPLYWNEWSESEIRILKDKFENTPLSEIEKLLPNRSKQMIKFKAKKLNLKKFQSNVQAGDPWTEEEISKAISYSEAGLSVKEIKAVTNSPRSERSIRRKLASLGYTDYKKWDSNEIQILKENYSCVSLDEMTKLLPNRSREAIVDAALKRNIKPFHSWSREENDFLKENFLSYTDDELGRILNRTPTAIKSRRLVMRLVRCDQSDANYKALSQYLRANTKWWLNKTKENCGHHCVFTGSDKFDVHHLDSVNVLVNRTLSILGYDVKDYSKYTEKELTNILNVFSKQLEISGPGVCIHPEIHKKFHRIYGYHNNTKDQFVEFVDNGLFNL